MFRLLILLLLSFSAKAQEVYKTPSGAKYHLATCRMVKNISEKITLAEAGKLGLEPCKICAPPILIGKQEPTKEVQGEGGSVRCSGYTKTGNRCKNMTKIGNGYCYHHQP